MEEDWGSFGRGLEGRELREWRGIGVCGANSSNHHQEEQRTMTTTTTTNNNNSNNNRKQQYDYLSVSNRQWQRIVCPLPHKQQILLCHQCCVELTVRLMFRLLLLVSLCGMFQPPSALGQWEASHSNQAKSRSGSPTPSSNVASTPCTTSWMSASSRCARRFRTAWSIGAVVAPPFRGLGRF